MAQPVQAVAQHGVHPFVPVHLTALANMMPVARQPRVRFAAVAATRVRQRQMFAQLHRR
jgi:hypothetical protein